MEWDIPKIYQYIIFKTLSVQNYENKMQFHNFVDGKKEFIKPKWFERMTCGGIIGTTSTYFGTLLDIVIERKNYINLFQRLFRTTLCNTVTNTPLQPYLFSSFEEMKKYTFVCGTVCQSTTDSVRLSVCFHNI